jgi:hypothetical protein
MSDQNPIEQVAAAEGSDTPQRTAGERLNASTVQEVRDVMSIMDTSDEASLTSTMNRALAFAQSEEATDEQSDDVAVMFSMLVSYFDDIRQHLTSLTLENLLAGIVDDDANFDDDGDLVDDVAIEGVLDNSLQQ